MLDLIEYLLSRNASGMYLSGIQWRYGHPRPVVVYVQKKGS